MNYRTQRPAARVNQQPKKFPIAPVVVVAAILAVLIGVAIAGNAMNSNNTKYDWNNLANANGRMSYTEDGTVVSTTAIDVSSLQGEINWSAVKNDGIDFAIIRCGRRGTTEGGLYTDERFYKNVTGCTSAGLPYGVYFYSQAVNEEEAREEAQYVLNLINGAGVSYPVVYDQEHVANGDARANGLSASQLTANAQTFCDAVYAAGYETMIYGNQYDLSRLNINNYKGAIWYAEYEVEHPSTSYHDFVMWQYSNSGHVAGISTAVDMDILFHNDWVSRER